MQSFGPSLRKLRPLPSITVHPPNCSPRLRFDLQSVESQRSNCLLQYRSEQAAPVSSKLRDTALNRAALTL